jgi:8-oxo-dGDP phosphatase
MPGMVDTPHQVFVGSDAILVGEPTDLEEAARVDWVPLAAVNDLIAKGQILGSGSIVGLLYLLSSQRHGHIRTS